MKRKGFECEFPSLSLFRKSRRLDGEMLSVMEEDSGTEVPQLPEQQQIPTSSIVRSDIPSSEERALVLYDPFSTPFLKSPSSPAFSIVLNSDLIPGLRDCLIWPGDSMKMRKMGFERDMDESEGGSNDCLAVIPWVAPSPPPHSATETATTLSSDTVDHEDTEFEMMEIEESAVATNNNKAVQFGELSEGFHHWQQQGQYRIAPQPAQNMAAPITW